MRSVAGGVWTDSGKCHGDEKELRRDITCPGSEPWRDPEKIGFLRDGIGQKDLSVMPRTTPTDEQKHRVLETAAGGSARNFAVLSCLFALGLRAHELSQLRVGHVALDTSTLRPAVRIKRKLLKGGRGERHKGVRSREIPLNDEARYALERYLAERARHAPLDLRAPLFLSREGGAALSRWQITRVVQEAFRAAGLEGQGGPPKEGNILLMYSRP